MFNNNHKAYFLLYKEIGEGMRCQKIEVKSE